MKAIVYTKYGPPDVLQLKEVSKPEPKDNQVLVKVHAASANALDYRRFEKISTMGRFMEERLLKTINKVLGADIAGQVVACGVIPMLTSASAPPTLPVTGGAAFSLMAATAGVLGLCALSAGLFLRQRSQPRRRF